MDYVPLSGGHEKLKIMCFLSTPRTRPSSRTYRKTPYPLARIYPYNQPQLKDIAEDATAPFCFLMDASMLGVGVGFDTKGAGKINVVAPGSAEGLEVGTLELGLGLLWFNDCH